MYSVVTVTYNCPPMCEEVAAGEAFQGPAILA